MRETLITAHTIDPLAGLLRVCSMYLCRHLFCHIRTCNRFSTTVFRRQRRRVRTL